METIDNWRFFGALSNLQPLEAKENLYKNNRYKN